MNESGAALKALIDTVARRIIEHADELTALDQAIGDGDHGINMKRGFEEVRAKLDEHTAKSPPEALKAVGMALVMKVGGASGPLYGTLIMSLGKGLPEETLDSEAVARALGNAIDAVKARGRSDAGQKTMLDVLIPVHQTLLSDGADPAALRKAAGDGAEATVAMKAQKGRASYLGDRSVGHMDPGARSSALIVNAVCDFLEERQ